MHEILINLGEPTIAFLPLLPLVGLLFTGGAIATTAVVASNLSDEPTTVNTFNDDARQSTSGSFNSGFSFNVWQIIGVVALAAGGWYFWKKKK